MGGQRCVFHPEGANLGGNGLKMSKSSPDTARSGDAAGFSPPVLWAIRSVSGLFINIFVYKKRRKIYI